MLEGWFIILISLTYVGILFAIAYYGDNHAKDLLNSRARPVVYSLSLAVYATSWTFYGAVGRASTSGWEFLATYLGPIITFIVLWPVFTKIILVSKKQNITTISDFIASRYGKSQGLAILVTIIAVLGIVPYIALQLKAVAISYNALTNAAGEAANGSDTALFVALLMALFSILFGTRHIDATEHHEGIVLAVAFESIVKLAAFIAVGLFVTFGVFDGFDDLFTKAAQELANNENFRKDLTQNSFITETLLAALAIICLPRQFHVAVVENADIGDLRVARWIFPLYLLLASLFVLPIATAGMLTFPDGSVDADSFVLSLPLANGESRLAVIAFIGGLSAATSMVIVATITLSTMVCNDIVIPLLMRIGWTRARITRLKDLGSLLLKIRRLTIINLMLLAYFYYRIFGESGSLASFGLLAFVAVAQFAPALLAAVLWKQGNRQGALVGISAGFLVWLYTLVMPTMAAAGLVPQALQDQLWQSEWLQPTALFGIQFNDSLTHGTFWSLLLNCFFFFLFSRYSAPRLIDRIQASTYVDQVVDTAEPAHALSGNTTVGDLQLLAERFIGVSKASHAFTGFALQRGEDPPLSGDKASHELIDFTERLLAGVIGASSARILIASTLRGRDMQLGDVVTIVDEATQVLKFNRSLLQSTIENINQGISVVDQQLRLVAWNRRYLELFDYPEGLICVGRPAAEVFRYNAEMGEYGPGEIEHHVGQRLSMLQSGKAHSYIRYRQDGTVLEVQGNPMPGGGYVNTYMDITEHKRTEEALRESEQSIRLYTDNVPVLIAYLDKERRYLFVNKAYAEVFGIRDRHAISGTPCYKVLKESDYDHRTPFIANVLKGERQRFETRLPTTTGEIRYADVTYIPHIGEYGDVLGYFTLYQDITERRKAELALQETNENLEQRVHERTQAISAINKELRKENTIRALIEDELRQAKSEADAANLGKTRFLAAASHDLLQPLNASRLFASALAQQSHNDATAQLVTNLDGSLKAAEELLVTLLDISKLDAGALEPNVTHFTLDPLFNTLKAEFGVMAQEKGLAFRCVHCKQVVQSDQQLLRRVLQNFLSNAIRYTQSGRLLLGCRRVGSKLRIEVWDTGVGIPEGKLKEVFEEFRRIDNPKHSQVKGLGLGLAITERIAKMLSHRLQVRSWPGKGTVFSVELALGDPQQVAQPQRAAGGSRRSSNLSGVKVLCIDNEPNILEGMAALLQGWSCEVRTALSEGDALQQVQDGHYRPDIILADYHLGETQTGVMALQALSQHWDQPVPAIVITADRTDEVQEEVRDFGAHLLHKPMRPAALRALMTTLLGQR
ncbi:hybrid sensor histidine kinase/response regulator [Motiliproteus sediminis]|uniref:hybrid sensor histidine kinase/response regulator n=1 Tax=Motiliproteus sediminis TaxID=1468178 RepID=UPI001AEF8E1E|nr:NahK/ErcS family hybrid sensor histidine kinase/response regulator [Motiliproteus sediminis]